MAERECWRVPDYRARAAWAEPERGVRYMLACIPYLSSLCMYVRQWRKSRLNGLVFLQRRKNERASRSRDREGGWHVQAYVYIRPVTSRRHTRSTREGVLGPVPGRKRPRRGIEDTARPIPRRLPNDYLTPSPTRAPSRKCKRQTSRVLESLKSVLLALPTTPVLQDPCRTGLHPSEQSVPRDWSRRDRKLPHHLRCVVLPPTLLC